MPLPLHATGTNSSDAHRSRPRHRSGLTLLELMVVLVILAIVATVALQSLQPRVDSQRVSATAMLLREVRDATIGPLQKYQTDGTPLVSGFVSDVGRLPLGESSDAELASVITLGELWDVQSGLAISFPYQFRSGPAQPIDYSKIRLPCGWRGPYLQLPIGMNSLKDPWGRLPEVLTDERGRAEFVRVLPPVTLPDEQAPAEERALQADLTIGKVQVTGKVLVDNPESSTIQVALLTPNPDSSLSTLVVLDDEDSQADSFVFRDVPVGYRAVVADADGRREVKYLQVPHGGLTVTFDFRTREPTE